MHSNLTPVDIAANNLIKMNLKHLPFKYYFLYTKTFNIAFLNSISEDPLSNMMVKLHQCSHCDYKASQKGNLQKHIESIHESLKFSCILCSAQFSMKTSLETHIDTFPCPHCEYKGTEKGDT